MVSKTIQAMKELELTMLDLKRHGDQRFSLDNVSKSKEYFKQIKEIKTKERKNEKSK